MQTSVFKNSATTRIAAIIAGVFATLGGCSSSDKGPAATTVPVEGGGHHEAAVSYKECKGPQVLLSGVDSSPTGYTLCTNSNNGLSMHRQEVSACPSKLPRTNTCTGLGSGTDAGAQIGICRSDADCTQGPEGHCTTNSKSPSCSCFYGCKTDADCTSDRICVCTGELTGECILAKCKSDADCSPGSLCLSASDGACRRIFACQAADDACAGDKDCPPAYSQCTFDGTHRVCKAPPNCGI